MRTIVGLVMTVGLVYAQSVVAGELVRYEHDMQIASNQKSGLESKITKTSKVSKQTKTKHYSQGKKQQHHTKGKSQKGYGRKQQQGYGQDRYMDSGRRSSAVEYNNSRKTGYQGNVPAPSKTSLDDLEQMNMQMDRLRDHH
jgi:hypothetical protein